MFFQIFWYLDDLGTFRFFFLNFRVVEITPVKS